MERVSLAGRKKAWVAGSEPCRATRGAVRNGAGRAPKISHMKTTTLMSRKTPQPKSAGKAKVAHTTTKPNTGEAPIYHVGLDVHAAGFTTAIAEAHRRYLRELVMAHPAQKQTLDEYLMAVTAAEERAARCEEAMRTLLVDWRRRPANHRPTTHERLLRQRIGRRSAATNPPAIAMKSQTQTPPLKSRRRRRAAPHPKLYVTRETSTQGAPRGTAKRPLAQKPHPAPPIKPPETNVRRKKPAPPKPKTQPRDTPGKSNLQGGRKPRKQASQPHRLTPPF